MSTEQKESNKSLWESFGKTDPSFIKTREMDGRIISSITGMYMEMKATEAFGPKGKGWGVDLVSERLDDGEPLFYTDPSNGQRNLITTPAGPLLSKNHTCIVNVWYVIDGMRYDVQGYGATNYLYNTKYGPKSDGEAPKKSFTDAMKKALSGIGICNDIYLGYFDSKDYVDQVAAEVSVVKSEATARDAEEKIRGIMQQASDAIDQIQLAGTQSEINGIQKVTFKLLTGYFAIYSGRGDTETASRIDSALKKMTKVIEARREVLKQNSARKNKPDSEAQGESEQPGDTDNQNQAESPAEDTEGQTATETKKRAPRKTSAKK